MKNDIDTPKHSISIRFFFMCLFGVIGVAATYVAISAVFPALRTDSIESLFFVGKGNSFIVYGYKALFQHFIGLVCGVGFLVLSVEQFKIIKRDWRL